MSITHAIYDDARGHDETNSANVWRIEKKNQYNENQESYIFAVDFCWTSIDYTFDDSTKLSIIHALAVTIEVSNNYLGMYIERGTYAM